MTYVYKTLSEDDKNKMLVETLRNQERDLFSHSLNLERYENISNDSDIPDGPMKDLVTKEIPVIRSRIDEVRGIIRHLEPQLPEDSVIQATLDKIKNEEALLKN